MERFGESTGGAQPEIGERSPIPSDNPFVRVAHAVVSEIKWQSCGRAVLSVAPIVAFAIVTGDAMWLRAGIVAISSHIAAERTLLTLQGIALHGIAIALGFSLLFFTLQVPLLFVVSCGLFGAGTILLTARGQRLRSLGNFTFIPSVYTACELADGLAPHEFGSAARAFYPYLAGAMLPVLVFNAIHQWREFKHAQPHATGESPVERSRRWRLFQTDDEGPPVTEYMETMAAVGIGVALAALLVELRGLHFGQWVIWSAASVVTGNVASSRIKVRDRALGVFIGVPAGTVLSFLLPHTMLGSSLAILGVMLTLVTFRHYVVAFSSRCGLMTLSLVLAGGATYVGLARVVNVLLGGLAGILSVLVVHAATQRFGRREPTAQDPA